MVSEQVQCHEASLQISTSSRNDSTSVCWRLRVTSVFINPEVPFHSDEGWGLFSPICTPYAETIESRSSVIMSSTVHWRKYEDLCLGLALESWRSLDSNLLVPSLDLSMLSMNSIIISYRSFYSYKSLKSKLWFLITVLFSAELPNLIRQANGL